MKWDLSIENTFFSSDLENSYVAEYTYMVSIKGSYFNIQIHCLIQKQKVNMLQINILFTVPWKLRKMTESQENPT